MTKLCVPVREETSEAMLGAMRGLPGCVDTVEVRLDYLWNARPQLLPADVERICSGKDRPIIATNRPRREGGLYEGPEDERLESLRKAATLGAEYVDIELGSVAALGEITGGAQKIVSYHNFQETPPNLDGIHRSAAAAGADVVKIAVMARDILDTLPVLALLERHAATIPTIALSMGEEGLTTRVIGAKLGAFLVYSCAKEGRETAPGQIPYDEMEGMYRFSRIGAGTAVFGVVANPVAHSMSPAIHNAAFAEVGLDAVYLPFKVTDPGPFLDGYEPYDLKGLSVTIPHKEAMVFLMDELDEMAERADAVNTVVIRDGRRYGSNTDVAAALAALESAAGRAGLVPFDRCTVLLLGAGGAARALAYGLAGRVTGMTIANRTVSRARDLASEVDARWCGLGQIAELRPDILINTTSVGMYPNLDESPVPPPMLRDGMVVFDAVYNPVETKLLRQARETGCVTASGFEWFVTQAVAQFETWTGLPAPRERMAEAVRERLSQT